MSPRAKTQCDQSGTAFLVPLSQSHCNPIKISINIKITYCLDKDFDVDLDKQEILTIKIT